MSIKKTKSCLDDVIHLVSFMNKSEGEFCLQIMEEIMVMPIKDVIKYCVENIEEEKNVGDVLLSLINKAKMDL